MRARLLLQGSGDGGGCLDEGIRLPRASGWGLLGAAGEEASWCCRGEDMGGRATDIGCCCSDVPGTHGMQGRLTGLQAGSLKGVKGVGVGWVIRGRRLHESVVQRPDARVQGCVGTVDMSGDVMR